VVVVRVSGRGGGGWVQKDESFQTAVSGGGQETKKLVAVGHACS
jgi:hypothetical protein